MTDLNTGPSIDQLARDRDTYRMLLQLALQVAHDQHTRIVAQQATIDGQRAELQRYVRSIVE